MHSTAQHSTALTSLHKFVKHFMQISALTALVIPTAFAQDNVNPLPETTLEPIIVESESGSAFPGVNQGYISTRTNTATGMNLEYKETPQSISVTTQERMQDEGLDSIDDVVRTTTGLSTRSYDANRVRYSARGIPVRTIIHDGTPITWDTRFAYGDKMLDTAVYERVEIVRGANGLMQGAGTPSAAVNMVHKRPTYEFSGEAMAGGGDLNKKLASIDVSGPLSDNHSIRGRAVYAYKGFGGGSWQDRAKSDQNTFYGILEADVSPNTMVTVGSMYQAKDADASMTGGLPLFYSDGSRTDYDRKVSTAPDWADYKSRISNSFASIDHHTDNGWNVKASYAHNDSKMDQQTLWATGNPDPITNKGLRPGSLYYIDGERKQDTFDLKVNGIFELFDRQHQLIAGTQYWKQTFSNPYYGAKAPLGLPYGAKGLNPDNPPLGDITNPNLTYPATAGYPEKPEWDFSKVAIGGVMNLEGETKQSSAYLASNLNLSDDINLLLGGRVDNWQTDQVNFGKNSNHKAKNQFTPYFGLTYDINDQLAVYGNYTSIFAPQSELDKNGTVLKPIVGKNYEVGIKSSLFDDKLQSSLSAFEIQQDNVAVADGVIAGTSTKAYRGQDGTKTRGIEAEVNGAITPEWNIFAGYTHAVTKDPDGKQLNTQSPKDLFKLFTTYDLSKVINGLTVGGGVYWQSGIYYDEATNPVKGKETVEQDAYATASVMARYRINDNASVSLNVDNVFDKKYYSQLGTFNQYTYGEPRSAMLKVNYKF